MADLRQERYRRGIAGTFVSGELLVLQHRQRPLDMAVKHHRFHQTLQNDLFHPGSLAAELMVKDCTILMESVGILSEKNLIARISDV